MIVSTVGLTQEGASAPSTSTSQTVVGIEKKHSDAVVNFILRMTCQVHLCSSTHIFFRLKYNALIKLSKVPSINCRVGVLQRFELCLFLCKLSSSWKLKSKFTQSFVLLLNSAVVVVCRTPISHLFTALSLKNK